MIITELHGLLFQVIGGFQPISRDTDDNSETNKCWWTNKRG